jgi:hypothetical protein
MYIKKIAISYWPEILTCSIMWNLSFFMAHKTKSVLILGLAAASMLVFAHMIAKIWLFGARPLRTTAVAGFVWGAACLGVQTFWAADVFARHYNIYGGKGFVVLGGGFLMFSLVACVFAVGCGLICAGVDAFFKAMLDLKSKFLRHLFLTLVVLSVSPLFFTYLSTLSLWPTMSVQGYPFFSPLLPLASSDWFLSTVEKLRGHQQHNNFVPQYFRLHWIEPKAYKENLRVNQGKSFNPNVACNQITQQIKAAIKSFDSHNPGGCKLLMFAPESSFPFKINEFPEIVEKWSCMMEPGQMFALGTYRSEGEKNFQTTCIIDHSGILKFVDKKRLTPFAESKFTKGESTESDKAIIDQDLTLVPLVCFEFFIDSSSINSASRPDEIPVIFANDSWYPVYFKTLLRNQARLSASWYGKDILYLSHFFDLCISPNSASLKAADSE